MIYHIKKTNLFGMLIIIIGIPYIYINIDIHIYLFFNTEEHIYLFLPSKTKSPEASKVNSSKGAGAWATGRYRDFVGAAFCALFCLETEKLQKLLSLGTSDILYFCY